MAAGAITIPTLADGEETPDENEQWRADPFLRTIVRPGIQVMSSDSVPDEHYQGWMFPPLYKDDLKGKQHFYYLIFSDGVVTSWSGQMLTERPKVNSKRIIPKSTRDMIAQALQETRRMYKKKTDKGYAMYASDGVFQVATGHVYDPARIKWDVGVAVQVKLDGVRMICQLEADGSVRWRTRGNRLHPTKFHHLNHEAASFLRYFPPGTILDGEIYEHRNTFSKIAGRVSEKKTRSAETDNLKYYIFDIVDLERGYIERYKRLVDVYRAHVATPHARGGLLILTITLAYSAAEVSELMQQFLNQFYEGAMVKILDGRYISGKAHGTMYKCKPWTDCEVTVKGVEDSVGTEAGCAVLVCVGNDGTEMRVRMCGSFERRRLWLREPHRVIGKALTIKQQITPGYVGPRFPSGVSFPDPTGVELRDYEGTV